MIVDQNGLCKSVLLAGEWNISEDAYATIELEAQLSGSSGVGNINCELFSCRRSRSERFIAKMESVNHPVNLSRTGTRANRPDGKHSILDSPAESPEFPVFRKVRKIRTIFMKSQWAGVAQQNVIRWGFKFGALMQLGNYCGHPWAVCGCVVLACRWSTDNLIK